MPEPLALHETKAFPEAEFNAFMTKAEEWAESIPEPDAITNDEMKKLSQMGDIKEADATLKVQALKRYNSFLTPQLALVLFIAKLTSYKQAGTLEKVLTVLIDKYWVHGILGGVDLLKMLAVAEILATGHAALGNSDAINYLNEVEKIKATRAKANKKAASDTTATKANGKKQAGDASTSTTEGDKA